MGGCDFIQNDGQDSSHLAFFFLKIRNYQRTVEIEIYLCWTLHCFLSTYCAKQTYLFLQKFCLNVSKGSVHARGLNVCHIREPMTSQ